MTRLVAFLLTATCSLSFSSFLPLDKDSIIGSDLQIRATRPKKSTKKSWKEIFRNQIETGNYRVLGHMAKSAVKDRVSLSKLAQYAKELDFLPFQNAVLATQRLMALRPKTGLSTGETLQLALYIETQLSDEVQKFGNYRSRNSTGLARTIEFDPESKLTFIHLKNHGGMKVLGQGF